MNDPYIWIAAILTLGVFSFLYKDNVFYCFIEHLLVGLSSGYIAVTYWNNVFMPELVTPLFLSTGEDTQLHLLFVVALCFMWACKYVEKTKDLYRIALAFWISVDLGLQIPTTMEAGIIKQIVGTIDISYTGSLIEIFGEFVIVFGTIAALVYFYFSKPQKGFIGATSKVGTWVLMIGFGATFGYTILSRVYLLIGRFLFLLRDWLGVIS